MIPKTNRFGKRCVYKANAILRKVNKKKINFEIEI